MELVSQLKAAWRVWRNRRKELAGAAEPVQLVYTDTEGNQWFAFEDPMRMPGDRALAALVNIRRADLNYTVEDEREWLEAALTSHNLGQHADVGYYLAVKRDRLTWTVEERTMLDVACVYFLLNDEPQGTMPAEHQERKRAIWAKDEACRAFFLREAYWLTRGFSELSLSDIPNYLAEKRKPIPKAPKRQPTAKRGGKRTASPSPEK